MHPELFKVCACVRACVLAVDGNDVVADGNLVARLRRRAFEERLYL